jgi:rod shape determining protein RodA
MGIIGMGAQRWINLVFFQFQPSELMRISLILALARYFNDNPVAEQLQLNKLVIPIALVIVPVFITIKQPDLGTAMLLLIGSGGLFFVAGVNLRFFACISIAFCGFLPVFWHFLHDYQRMRILMFLNPQSDPLGAGYHIIQSKIAIGSGGILGKGFLAGTQSTLNFLPEKQTDFIFTLLSEEFGFLGVVILILLYCSLILLNISFSFHVRDSFSRFVIVGMTLSFALYAVINIAMVVGFLPVVGIPLPLISYGGTSLITIMASLGIVLSAALYRTKTHCINRLPL